MFPIEVLKQHIAILGKTGSGKTYTARGLVEGMLERDERVCILDPTGVWWGLKASATGKRAGFPVVVFGGSHADMPISGAHGELIAEVIGTSTTPAILDTSQMRTAERTRFFTDFANNLLIKNKGPLHLIIDEAHLFAPQGKVMDPQSGQMVHAANNLVSLGRARGLRVTLITQRPAKLHKDSLTQVETLIALRLIAPQDRRAVEEWIYDQADEDEGKAIIASLPTLQTGQGWIWAPELQVLKKVNFPSIKTFDSSKAPDGAAAHSIKLAPIDISKIKGKLEAVVQEADANDPKKLRARISELERTAKRPLKDASGFEMSQKIFEHVMQMKETKNMLRAAHLDGHAEGLKEGVARGEKSVLDNIEKVIREIRKNPLKVSVDKKFPTTFKTGSPLKPARSSMDGERSVKPSLRQVGSIPSSPTNADLPRGERACLIAIAQHSDGVSREQLTVLTGYKRSSRDAYIQRLRERGHINLNGENIVATDAGFSALGKDFEPLPTGDDLLDHWFNKLPEGEKRVLEVITNAYPEAIDRESIDEATGYKRSSRDAYLQRLGARKLVVFEGRGTVRASEQLFD